MNNPEIRRKMPKAQTDFNKNEFAEMSIFRFKNNWTVRKLLKRAVLYYVRNDPEKKQEEFLKPEKGVPHE